MCIVFYFIYFSFILKMQKIGLVYYPRKKRFVLAERHDKILSRLISRYFSF